MESPGNAGRFIHQLSCRLSGQHPWPGETHVGVDLMDAGWPRAACIAENVDVAGNVMQPSMPVSQ